MRTLSAVFFLLLFGLAPALAVTNGGKSLSGVVSGADGKPLAGATVVIVGSDRGTTTNAVGAYRITGINDGHHTLRFSFIGYEPAEKKVQMSSSNEVVNITLIAKNVLGDEVIVSATRASSKTPMAFSDLKAYEIKRTNKGGDVAQIFELTPSFVSTSESGIGIGNTSFKIRGTDASRINITVDGFPINDPESQQVFFVNMPDIASSATSVQIQRGVGTSTNGSGAFGATMNFQTGAFSDLPYAEINNYLGSYNSWRGNFLVGTGLLNNRFNFDARISRATSDGYVDRATSDHKSALMTGAYHGKRSTLKATLIYGEEKTGISWTGVPSNIIDTNRTYNPEGYYYDAKGVLRTYDNHTDNYKQTHCLLNYSVGLSDNLVLSAGVFYTQGEGYYENYKDDAKLSKYGFEPYEINGDTYKKSDFIVQKWLVNDYVGGTFSLNYKPTQSVDLTLGGATSRFTNDHYGIVKWAEMNLKNFSSDYEWYRNDATKDDANVFAKANWQLSSDLNIFADVQYRNIYYQMEGPDDDFAVLTQSHTYNFVNPKFGAFYSLGNLGSLFASFSVANREPTRSDLKDGIHSDNLPSSERLLDYEFGYKYAGSGFSVGANLYYMGYKDQLVLTGKLNDVGNAIRENVPKSYRCGIELMGGVSIAKGLKWEGNVTLSQNKIKDFTYSVELYDDQKSYGNFEIKKYQLGTTSISFSPDVIGSSSFTYEPTNNLRFGFISKYVGKQYYDNSESADRMLDAYFVNNLQGEYDFAVAGVKNVSIQAGINNLFGEKYEDNAWIYRAEFRDGTVYRSDGLFPQALRNYWVRLSLKF